jgi:hypothetical protein
LLDGKDHGNSVYKTELYSASYEASFACIEALKHMYIAAQVLFPNERKGLLTAAHRSAAMDVAGHQQCGRSAAASRPGGHSLVKRVS